MISRAILKSFNPANYTASIQLTGSDRVFLEGINVARNIDSQEMVNGRELAVVFFNENNSKQAVIFAVFTAS